MSDMIQTSSDAGERRSARSMNLFANIPLELPEELIEVLSASPHVRIERIISRGHRSPPDFWYDQEMDEFVVVLAGSARLSFAEDNREIDLGAGDCLIIKAHEKHRVLSTAADTDTVWLAVHYRG